jgi:hypothetical protein
MFAMSEHMCSQLRCPVPQLDIRTFQLSDKTESSGGFCMAVRLEVQMLRVMVVDHSKASALELYIAKAALECKSHTSIRLQTLLRGCSLARLEIDLDPIARQLPCFEMCKFKAHV